jgi:hypothetical protein
MAKKENNKNGKAFQTKLSIAQLRTEVLQNKKSASEICEKYSIRPYTLQQKLYSAACEASNKTEALAFIMDIPSDIDNKVERKKNITIPSSLCDNLGISIGSKYEVSLDNKKIVLTPVK